MVSTKKHESKSRMRLRTAAMAACLLSNLANSTVIRAETPPNGATFEVASLKLSTMGSNGSGINYRKGRFTATGVTLKLLIKEAYQVKGFQITGAPEWTNSQRYDINANTSTEISIPVIREMLQNLLVERLKLSIRRDTKELPVYALVMAKTGAKIGEKVGNLEMDHQFFPANNSFRGQASMLEVADYLSGQLQRVVVDRTGLEGIYNVAFKYIPEGKAMRTGDGSLNGDNPDGVSIFDAIQGLGLRLESQKALVPVLSIDHLEREPAEN